VIPVTPLQGRTILVNADLIEQIERVPDTVIVLANGRRMFVLDDAEELVRRIRHVRASILAYADDLLDHGTATVVPLDAAAERNGGEGR